MAKAVQRHVLLNSELLQCPLEYFSETGGTVLAVSLSGRLAPEAVGLLFQGRAVVHRKAVDLGGGLNPSLALLLHMGQLVAQQPLASRIIGAELAGRKMDVASLGIGKRPHCRGGGRFGVDPDARKIGVKRTLHPGLDLIWDAGLVLRSLGHALAGAERGRQPFALRRKIRAVLNGSSTLLQNGMIRSLCRHRRACGPMIVSVLCFVFLC